MRLISTLFATILVALISCTAPGYAQSSRWPLDIKIDLSSGFGDYRDGRFHAGLDIRTGGRMGKRLVSPVDGYLYRFKMSYTGSGKALYIMADDGHIYVFYHLRSFCPEIDQVVKTAQVDAERYYVDVYLPRDSVRVAQGQYLGYTGQTGVGAPHLHFEKRTADNLPINLLSHGYSLRDVVAPTLTRVGFELVDDHSLFADGSRKSFRDLVTADTPDVYTLDSVLYFDSPFGLLVEGFDQMRAGGMQQTIYSLAAFVDGDLIYEVRLDTANFDTDRSVFLEYDYSQAVMGEKKVRRLFYREGNLFTGSRAPDDRRGIVGLDDQLTVGRHNLSIHAEDCFGNSVRAEFPFVWGPEDGLAKLDSAFRVADTLREFYFTLSNNFDRLMIDTLKVAVQQGGVWREQSDAEITRTGDRQLKVVISTRIMHSTILAFAAHSSLGVEIIGEPFNGIVNKAGKDVEIELEPVVDGLLVKLPTNSRAGSRMQLALFHQDSVLGYEFPSRFLSNKYYVVFIPPRPEYELVDRIDVIWSDDPEVTRRRRFDVMLVIVGYDKTVTVPVDSLFHINIGRDHLVSPQWLVLRKDPVVLRSAYGMNSDLYTILPEALVTAADFGVTYRVRGTQPKDSSSGLCWLDEKEDRWVWLKDSDLKNNLISATSMGGGRFAARYDLKPPVISRLNLVAGRSVDSPFPSIEFHLSDSTSGIADDRSIDIRIDRKWMIPEYDPETEICTTAPVEPLEPGDHHLAIIVTDRAGNKAEQYLIFNVAEGSR
ncbi:MAG: M23 family metallopeptidase [Candidatus Zixiibacteriota bacterium]|nr:MAG: M23 family metallopeptidase [candidate division Zixibacteria bacterium]